MFKKILTTFLIVTIMVGTFSPLLLSVPKANAQIPVILEASNPVLFLELEGVEKASGTFISKVIDQGLKVILEMLRKKLLDYFVDSTIRWIQGKDDQPAFVTNWRKFMGDVVNDAMGSYVETTKFAGICDTFDFQIRVSLPSVSSRPALPTCTLNQIVGNIENFYNDFNNGGWLAFNESLASQNNPYGAYIMAMKGQAYEVAAAQQEQEKELSQSSSGVKNTKKCAVEQTDSLTGEKRCLLETTTTPGNMIAQKVQQALNVDIDHILSATEFTAYVSAIADAATNRLLRAGKEGLLGMLTKEAPDNYDDLGTTGPSDIGYECDKDIGACVMKVGGKYSSKEDCTDKCLSTGETCNSEPELCSKTNIYVRGQKCDTGTCAVVGPNNNNPTCCDVFCSHMKDTMYPQETAKHSLEWDDAADNGIISAVCNYAGVPTASSCSCSISNVGGACFTGLPKAQCGNPLEEYPDYNRGLLICKGVPPYCQGQQTTSDNSDWPYPTCDACRAGVYVRGRGTPGSSTKGSCSANGTCTMCSAASQSTPTNLCQTFCEATREEAWGGKTGQNTRTFTQAEISSSGYGLIWGKSGISVPSDGCTCSYSGNYKKLNEYSFGNGYTHDDSYCYNCTNLPASVKNLSVWGADAAEPQAVCTGSTWCDKYCCPTCPTPPVHP